MDPRERYQDDIEALRVALEGHQAGLWTALPGVILSYDATKLAAVVQPTIQGIQRLPDLSAKYVNLPPLLDVPVVFPRGGGYSLTFPIAINDECLVIFSSRCIDNWWAYGGVQPPYEQRMHDLSDGFALVGPYSQPNTLSNVSTSTVQLRSDDGTIYVDLNKATGTATIKTPTEIVLNAPTISATGVLQVGGNVIAGYGGADQVGLQTHTHTDPQGGNTGAPNAGT